MKIYAVEFFLPKLCNIHNNERRRSSLKVHLNNCIFAIYIYCKLYRKKSEWKKLLEMNYVWDLFVF